MRKPYALIGGLFLASLLTTTPAWAANAARPGSLNYVEGQVSVGNQTVNAKSIGSVELEPGQSLSTGAGKAELLLTPGVFFRVGDNSSARMISPNLTDTEVELMHGNATVEVTDLHRENNLRVVEDGKSTQLVKQVKIKAGHEVSFNDEPLKTGKFDKKALESTELYRWTSLRSSYLAEANVDAARTYVVGSPGWFGYGWYWDPWFSAYTFIPGDGIFYSPFGWGFYSPGFAFGAPLFFGGHYHHYFSGDYRAWGPGFHYGLPANYGSGVHYGARPQAGGASGLRGGAAPQSFSAGGFYGGGFHGGGGFHR